MSSQLCPYGSHRVLEPTGVLPQPAWKLDNTPRALANEILIEVEMLNVDAASFTQIRTSTDGSEAGVAERILEIVAERGKLHNPVTGSGGMLIGRIAAIGPEVPPAPELQVGRKIATLVSLSLTPLYIQRIKKVHLDQDQVEIEGQAILFPSGLWAPLPEDLPERLALAVLDVAGAPAQTERLVQPGDRVLVIGGGGKAGLLCLWQAKHQAGPDGQVIGLGYSERDVERMAALGCVDRILQLDARQPLRVLHEIEAVTDGKLCDVVINCVNVPGTELASILACRERGKVYFFSMATSFTAAALGAEGVGKDVDLLIGNGYARGHWQLAYQLLRQQPLRRFYEEEYCDS